MIYFAMELANRINRDHPSDVNGCHGAKKKSVWWFWEIANMGLQRWGYISLWFMVVKT
jgi:hypothetical protein